MNEALAQTCDSREEYEPYVGVFGEPQVRTWSRHTLAIAIKRFGVDFASTPSPAVPPSLGGSNSVFAWLILRRGLCGLQQVDCTRLEIVILHGKSDLPASLYRLPYVYTHPHSPISSRLRLHFL